MGRARRSGRLDQVPAISEKIAKHGNGSIRLIPWGGFEHHALFSEGLEIPMKVIRFQKKRHAPTGLISDPCALFGTVGLGEQHFTAAIWRPDDNPSFRALRLIPDQGKSKITAIMRNRQIVIRDD